MGPQRPHPSPQDAEPLLAVLLDRLIEADHTGASRVVERALRTGWTVDDVRLSLITPALVDIGLRWERAQIGVADEHLASSVCEWLLFGLAGRAQRRPPIGRRAVVGCSEGELHSLGARIVGHMLVERGWTVLYLGAATPPEAWVHVVRARRPDVAVLCTTTPARLGAAAATAQAIKAARPACLTVVGGQAYWEPAARQAADGADLVAVEARTLAAQL